jgi:hypothetical protein
MGGELANKALLMERSERRNAGVRIGEDLPVNE